MKALCERMPSCGLPRARWRAASGTLYNVAAWRACWPALVTTPQVATLANHASKDAHNGLLKICMARHSCTGMSVTESRVQSEVDAVLIKLWGTHPSSERVNELLRDGCKLLNRSKGLPIALERFQEAVKADPLFAESWNKVATVLYLQQQCAHRWCPCHIAHRQPACKRS